MKFLDIVEPLYHFLSATSQLVSLRSISGPVTEDFIFNQFDLNIQYRADYFASQREPTDSRDRWAMPQNTSRLKSSDLYWPFFGVFFELYNSYFRLLSLSPHTSTLSILLIMLHLFTFPGPVDGTRDRAGRALLQDRDLAIL
jgi:hypothetical protein